MVDETKKDAPKAEESKEEATAKVEAKSETKAEAKVEEKDTKVSDIIGKPEAKAEKQEAKMVPEAVLLEYKNQNKELKKDIQELKKLIEDGASKKEVSQSIQEIAEEHNVDPDFLQKIVKTIKQEAREELEKEVSAKMKPFEEKDKNEKIEKAFNDEYSKVLEKYPEYKDIANKEVVKALTLNPKNSDKTFVQVLEEAYGHLVKGRKTLETTKSRVEQITDIDQERAGKDPEYFKEIMSDPELKKKYNEGLTKRLENIL